MLLRLVPNKWLKRIGTAIDLELLRRSLAEVAKIDEDANVFDDASLAVMVAPKRDALAPPPGQFGFGTDFSVPTPPPEVMSREELLAQIDALRASNCLRCDGATNLSGECIVCGYDRHPNFVDKDEEAVYCLQCRHRPCVCILSKEPF